MSKGDGISDAVGSRGGPTWQARAACREKEENPKLTYDAFIAGLYASGGHLRKDFNPFQVDGRPVKAGTLQQALQTLDGLIESPITNSERRNAFCRFKTAMNKAMDISQGVGGPT